MAKSKPQTASSIDHVELQANEIARRNDRTAPTDADRKLAYEEMQKRAQPLPENPPASH